MNPLNPLGCLSQEILRKILTFQSCKFLNDKIDQIAKCQIAFFGITADFIIQKYPLLSFGKEDNLIKFLSA